MRRTGLLSALALVCFAHPAAAQFPPDSFTNLRVLPKDIPAQQLVGMMAGFTRALGVRCTYCHVGEETIPLAEYDFASDEKETKRKARVMIEMVQAIHGHLEDLPARSDPPVSVQCVTCHRGTTRPRTLQDTLRIAYDAGGIAALDRTYRELRERWYGGAAFDFGEVALADVGGAIGGRPEGWADAERIHALNVEMNPTSTFARRQLAEVALARAFSTSEPAGRARLAELERTGPLPEAVLNATGYRILRADRAAAAVVLFRLITERHPGSWNAWDSLGEGLAGAGDVAGAIAAYERSLALNPENQNGRDRLDALHRR